MNKEGYELCIIYTLISTWVRAL